MQRQSAGVGEHTGRVSHANSWPKIKYRHFIKKYKNKIFVNVEQLLKKNTFQCLCNTVADYRCCSSVGLMSDN